MPEPFIIEIHHHYHSDDGDDQRQQPADPRLHQLLEKIVAQLDDLQADSETIKADLDLIKTFISNQADRITALTQQLATLQQTVPPQVDLGPVVTAANEIKAEADAIVASFTPAQPPADTGTSTPPATDPGTTTPPADTGTTTPPTDSIPPATDPTGSGSPDQTPA